MTTIRLNKSTIDRLEFRGSSPKTKCIYWDSEIPGYGIRIHQSGTKSYVFKYRFHGRQRYYSIGEVGILTPDQARQIAIQARADVSRGIDPLAERKRAARGESMLDLCRVYIDLHAKPHNKSWRKDLERMELFIVGRPEESHIDPKTGEKVIDRPAHRPPLPGLRNTKVKAVTRQDIIDLQRIIGVEMGKETTANRVLSLLSSMFTQARVQFGMLEPNSANPVEGVRRFPGRKRKRFMRKVEAPAVVAALNQEFNIYARAACWIYMLIGTRREELLAVRWEPHVDAPKDQEPDPHVVLDEEGNEHIYFHDTKAGREFILPLPTEAVAIFRELQKWRIAGNPYVFCGKKDGAHLVNITKPWRRVKKAAGVEGITIHDLRRTVGNRLREKTKDLGIVGAALNQTNASVQEVYGVYDVDPVREALEDHATELKRQTGGVNLLPVAPPKRDTTPRKYRKSKPAAPDQ